ncbi:hypothetical protein [Neorhizobium tomejilense]|uniref:hypothetical protein n=1 Tax=Neorhizobium tomejilense TaxID=2093828 RepID=UPI000CF88382|nr:hypothetical protein [Neorhizobium tomejilense]
MTDEELEKLLLDWSSARFVDWQNGKITLRQGEAPAGFEDSIHEILWYVGVKPLRGRLLEAGALESQIDAAFAARRQLHGIVEPADLVVIPADLEIEIDSDLRAFLEEEPESSMRRLDEKHVDWIKELRVEIYLNESQHRGRPHVAVFLPDGKISVSLQDPPVVLTPKQLRGEASARKVVEKHLVRLLKLWETTRPDDQRLPPSASDST